MRCDVNISVMPEGSKELGTRTEIKNMNSVSHIEKAMAYEYERQIDVLEDGGKIEQATLRYDENSGETSVMRTKEDAQDYRYFPEPDIMTVVIPEEKIEEIKNALPELPDQKLKRYTEDLKINPVTARQIYKYKKVCDFVEKTISLGASVKNTVNLTTGILFSKLETEEDKENFALPVTAEETAKLIKLADEGKINITLAQKTLLKMAEEGKGVDEYIKPEDLVGVDDSELENICRLAIENNKGAVADFRSGKDKAIFALYGYVKKATQGKADIKKADEILRKLINNG